MTDSSALLAFPVQPEDRLRLSLRRLQTALDQQAAAVREFREEIGRLKHAALGLEDSVIGYRLALSGTAAQVADAQAAARQLQDSARALQAASQG